MTRVINNLTKRGYQMKPITAIETIRKSKGLTQSDLAAKIGAYQKDICRWETGERKPEIESLKKLADAVCNKRM